MNNCHVIFLIILIKLRFIMHWFDAGYIITKCKDQLTSTNDIDRWEVKTETMNKHIVNCSLIVFNRNVIFANMSWFKICSTNCNNLMLRIHPQFRGKIDSSLKEVSVTQLSIATVIEPNSKPRNFWNMNRSLALVHVVINASTFNAYLKDLISLFFTN